MVERAAKLEYDAKKFRDTAAKEQDPARRQALLVRADAETNKASVLRGEALSEHAVRGRNAERSDKLQKVLADTQTGLSLIDEIINKRKEFGAQWSIKTNADREMQTKLALLELQVKEAFALGALDKGSEAHLKRITGGDVTKITPGDIIDMLDTAAGTEASLGALGDALEMRARSELGGAMRDPSRLQFKRDRVTPGDVAAKAAFARDTGKTPAEAAAGTERTGVGRVAEAIFNPLGESPAPRRALAANEGGDVRFPSLTKPQADHVELQLRAYKENKAADTPAGAAAAEKAAGTLLGLAKNADRPALTTAMLGVLESEAPELYQRAVESLPAVDPQIHAKGYRDQNTPPVPNQKDILERRQMVMGMQPVELLLETARAGDVDAKQELARRAVAGDKNAISAIANGLTGGPR